MPFSVKQQEYLRNATHRWNIKTGATRSGKTYLDYTVIPKRILNCTGSGLVVLLGNTKSTLERNILEPMRGIWGQQLIGQISSNNTVNIFGRRCHALGAEKVSQKTKVQGSGIEYCYGDEITTWNEEVFTMLKSRLDKPNSCFDGTCNPDNPNHWFKLFLDGNADIYQQSYEIYDNPFLTPEFISNLEREYEGTVYFDRYILGRWVAAEGIIYRQFADNPNSFIVDTPPPVALAVIGVDFGGNGSAHAFSCLGFTYGFREVVMLEEYYRKEIITPAQLEEDFVNFVHCCSNKYKLAAAYCDSAEQTLIQGLRTTCARERLPLAVNNALKKPINDRVRFFSRLMSTGRFRIMDSCSHTIEALKSALWDKKSLVEDKRLDDGTTNIDSLDALEYACEPYMHSITRLI